MNTNPIPSGLMTPNELIVDFLSPIIRASFRRVNIYETSSSNSSQLNDINQLDVPSDLQQDIMRIKESGVTKQQMITRNKLIKDLDRAPRQRRPYAKADGSLDYSKRSREELDDDGDDDILENSLRPKKVCSGSDSNFSCFLDESQNDLHHLYLKSQTILDESLPEL